MAEHNKAVAIEVTPATEITVAMFEEIEGPIPLVGPTGIDDAAGIVDDEERTGAKNGVHRPVLRANDSIAFAPGFDAIEHMNRKGTPACDDAAKKGSFGEVNARIEAERYLNFTESIGRKMDGMSLFELVKICICRLLVEINSIPRENFTKAQTINRRKRVDAEDRRHNGLVFDFAQAAETNRVFLIRVAFGDFLTGYFNFAELQSETFSNLAQPLACFVSTDRCFTGCVNTRHVRNFQKNLVSIIWQFAGVRNEFLTRVVLKTEQEVEIEGMKAHETQNCDWHEWRVRKYLWIEAARETAQAGKCGDAPDSDAQRGADNAP